MKNLRVFFIGLIFSCMQDFNDFDLEDHDKFKEAVGEGYYLKSVSEPSIDYDAHKVRIGLTVTMTNEKLLADEFAETMNLQLEGLQKILQDSTGCNQCSGEQDTHDAFGEPIIPPWQNLEDVGTPTAKVSPSKPVKKVPTKKKTTATKKATTKK